MLIIGPIGFGVLLVFVLLGRKGVKNLVGMVSFFALLYIWFGKH